MGLMQGGSREVGQGDWEWMKVLSARSLGFSRAISFDPDSIKDLNLLGESIGYGIAKRVVPTNSQSIDRFYA